MCLLSLLLGSPKERNEKGKNKDRDKDREMEWEEEMISLLEEEENY
jgi:hypothetical protein